ncbi:ash family protein [Aeromonas allosaccharophila]|uniref:ash family protein n=1 Tax=Aeromonas allosaccharophila TaxID=656 RepID=UPI003986D007
MYYEIVMPPSIPTGGSVLNSCAAHRLREHKIKGGAHPAPPSTSQAQQYPSPASKLKYSIKAHGLRQGACLHTKTKQDAQCHLSDMVQYDNVSSATAKSVAGRRNPDETIAPTHALAWFFVGARSPFFGVLLAHLPSGACCVMVARAGQPRGWPVSIVAGIPTPARATAMSVGTLVGSEYLSTIEAAIMATIPTLATSKVFTFLLAAHGCRVAELPCIRTVSTTAYSEDEARAHLPGLPLVFLSRTPSKGATV